MRQMQLIFHFEMAECYAIWGQWDKAIAHYSAFLQENKTTSYRCWCACHLGIAYCMVGDTQQARIAFQQVQGFARKYYSFDAFCLRKAREYLLNDPLQPMSPAEMLLTQARLERQGRMWNECMAHLEQAKALLKETDYEEWVQYYYLKGRSLGHLGQPEEAEAALEAAVALRHKVKREVYLIPHSYNELGELYMKRLGLGQNSTTGGGEREGPAGETVEREGEGEEEEEKEGEGRDSDRDKERENERETWRERAEKMFRKAKTYSGYDFD
eukprot:TRINITY_DN3776_c0_g1_i2.p1 TRINITY_DN3776_c0_g1~~TRINITY_DN3776_c0_g1_i2.p1  ORF type:complete len:270 (-),score=49.82 TRINITY_DN3776_c0_g1_i2:60-869(-)